MKKISFRNDVLPLKDQLYRLALRITLSKEEAEDIVQETMIKVWNKRDSWESIDSIEAFSFTICRNLSLDKMRKMGSRSESIEDTHADRADFSYNANPEERAVQKDKVDTVRSIISSLPEKQRTAMQLRDFEGKSYKEIAEVMGISEDQVKVNIFRARQTVKQKYTETEEYGL